MKKTATKEWWLRAAISDDTLVAGLLLCLKDTSSSSSYAAAATTTTPLPRSWGLRQPRSSKRDSLSHSNTHSAPRRSPTTPLSFAASDFYDDSSKSKISASTETPTTSGKRTRRKKTFAELKEEESSLLKERTYLKEELATLHLTLKEQRSINENLKRMKLDMHVESGIKGEANSIEQAERNANHIGVSEAASSSASRQVKTEDASESDSCVAQRSMTTLEPMFVLPDLNMMPEEECDQGPIVGLC